MLVKMKTQIGGYRNEVAWPETGGTIDLPDHEAADLIHNGYAEEATDDDRAAAQLEDSPAVTDDDPDNGADDDPDNGADDDVADAAADPNADPADVTAPAKRARSKKA